MHILNLELNINVWRPNIVKAKELRRIYNCLSQSKKKYLRVKVRLINSILMKVIGIFLKMSLRLIVENTVKAS